MMLFDHLRTGLFTGIIMLLTPAVQAEELPLTTQEAQIELDATQANNVSACGVPIPVGEFKFPEADTYEGGPQHALAQQLVALKEAGAINIIDLPGMLGFVHFRVEVAKDVDESQLTASGASTRCVKSIVTRPTITVLKVDMVKGGRTQWDGAIVYYTVTNTQFTELFRKYVIASKRDWVLGGTRVRELWKYDIFNKTWKRNPVTDGGPLNGEFMTSRVPEALERD